MRLSVRRALAPGALLRDGIAEHTVLGCAAPAASPEAAELGLVSVRLEVVVGARRVPVPPWVTPASVPLPRGVLRAVVATVGQVTSGMAPLLAAAAAALTTGAATGSPGVAGSGALALLVLASVLVHEVGHVAAYRILYGPTAPALFVVRGAACRLVRRADDGRSDVAVVVAGALAPAAVAVAALPLAAGAPVAVLLGGLVALGHVAALALPFGDGASLRAIIRARREASGSGDAPPRRVSVVGGATRRRSPRRAG